MGRPNNVGAIKPKVLSMIAKIGQGYLCRRGGEP